MKRRGFFGALVVCAGGCTVPACEPAKRGEVYCFSKARVVLDGVELTQVSDVSYEIVRSK